MILHTVNKRAAWDNCRQSMAKGDKVILIEDGVNLALTITDNVLVLDADAAARGLTSHLKENVSPCSYKEFVALSAEADKVISWF